MQAPVASAAELDDPQWVDLTAERAHLAAALAENETLKPLVPQAVEAQLITIFKECVAEAKKRIPPIFEERIARARRRIADIDSILLVNRPPASKRAWRINELQAAYGLSRSTIYNLKKEGKLRTVKVGGRRMVPQAAIDELFAAGAHQPTGARDP